MKRTWLACIALLLVASLAGECRAQSPTVDHSAPDQAQRLPQAALDRARQMQVVFGHQSVGANILAGLRYLAQREPGRYAMTSVTEFQIGRNGNPQSKVADFTGRVSRMRCDVAMMKFCFVDLQPQADPGPAFESYRAGMESLRGCRIVWWTMPLTIHNNRARNEFNNRVRAWCRSHNQPLYDLADIESHGPSGDEATDGQGPCLHPAWSRDGGHLNPAGATRAAQAWWVLLAQLGR